MNRDGELSIDASLPLVVAAIAGVGDGGSPAVATRVTISAGIVAHRDSEMTPL